MYVCIYIYGISLQNCCSPIDWCLTIRWIRPSKKCDGFHIFQQETTDSIPFHPPMVSPRSAPGILHVLHVLLAQEQQRQHAERRAQTQRGQGPAPGPGGGEQRHQPQGPNRGQVATEQLHLKFGTFESVRKKCGRTMVTIDSLRKVLAHERKK